MLIKRQKSKTGGNYPPLRMPLSKKITITVTEVFLFQVLLPLVLKKKNKHAEYHVIFIPFKG